MEKELDVRLEAIHYIPRFARPAFQFWGAGGKVARHLYDALSPFGATLSGIQVSQTMPDASGIVFTVSLPGNSSAKFAFDRMEFVLNGFTEEFFQSIPKLFRGCTEWIRHESPDFKFASHNIAYFCHAFVKDSTTKEILDTINPKSLKSAGSNLGNGTIFHFYEVERNWQVRIMFDHSLAVPGALFVGLVIDTTTDEIDYDAMFVDGRVYLQSALAELGLRLPDFSQQ
jgi:hypothetical protein